MNAEDTIFHENFFIPDNSRSAENGCFLHVWWTERSSSSCRAVCSCTYTLDDKRTVVFIRNYRIIIYRSLVMKKKK